MFHWINSVKTDLFDLGMRMSFPNIKYRCFIGKIIALGGNGAPFAHVGTETRMGSGHQSQFVRN